MSEPFLIRDVYSLEVVKKIATDIKNVYASFDQKGFLDVVLPEIPTQTYSERKENITNGLIRYLPKDYKKSIDILLKVTPPPYIGDADSDMVGRFYIATFTSYVSQKGLDSYDISVNALYEMTKSFTAEWDIRPFLLQYPDRTLTLMKKWAKDKNIHVRRLVSEGSRPNLPWGKKLKFVDEDPKHTTLPLLSLLQDDDSEYVRRSVANHLNDLSKNNGDIVVNLLTQWRAKKSTPDKERMINHALRTLVKQGHQGALSLIGFKADFDLDIELNSIIKEVNWNGKFEFKYLLKNKKKVDQKLLIDFIIGFQKKDGKISNKVFKLKKTNLAANGEIEIAKGHSFKPIITRVYYPGKHLLYLQVNGKIVAEQTFMLLNA